MSISDCIKDIKEKNTPSEMEYQLTPCSHCKQPETKYCLKCEMCGRRFNSKGELILDILDEKIFGATNEN